MPLYTVGSSDLYTQGLKSLSDAFVPQARDRAQMDYYGALSRKAGVEAAKLEQEQAARDRLADLTRSGAYLTDPGAYNEWVSQQAVLGSDPRAMQFYTGAYAGAPGMAGAGTPPVMAPGMAPAGPTPGAPGVPEPAPAPGGGALTFVNPGQEGIDPGFRSALERAGMPLRITSGYQGRPTRPGSMHPRGQAVDIDMSGMTPEQRAHLVRRLRAAGVMRFGTYDNHPNMLHVDMSDAQGGNWYMHNASNAHLGQAPEWFRGVAAEPFRFDGTRPVPAGAPGGPAGPVAPGVTDPRLERLAYGTGVQTGPGSFTGMGFSAGEQRVKTDMDNRAAMERQQAGDMAAHERLRWETENAPIPVGTGQRLYDPATGDILLDADPSKTAPSGTIKNYKTPDGKQGSTRDGVTDLNTGEALPGGTVTYSGLVSADSPSKIGAEDFRALNLTGQIAYGLDDMLGAMGLDVQTGELGPGYRPGASLYFQDMFSGVVGDATVNWVRNKADQTYAYQRFATIEPLLRLRSGAATPEEEVRRYQLYMPRPGDSEDLMRKKLLGLLAMRDDLVALALFKGIPVTTLMSQLGDENSAAQARAELARMYQSGSRPTRTVAAPGGGAPGGAVPAMPQEDLDALDAELGIIQ